MFAGFGVVASSLLGGPQIGDELLKVFLAAFGTPSHGWHAAFALAHAGEQSRFTCTPAAFPRSVVPFERGAAALGFVAMDASTLIEALQACIQYDSRCIRALLGATGTEGERDQAYTKDLQWATYQKHSKS